MENQEFSRPFQEMLEYQKKILEALERNAQSKKDVWDRFSTISTFLSGFLIAAMGLIFTYSYNNQQAELLKVQNQRADEARQYETRILEMQTIEKFIPHLTGQNEEGKRGAIMVVALLANKQLASRLGALYASPGTIDAIQLLLKDAEGESKTALKASLTQAYFQRGKLSIDMQGNLDQAIQDYEQVLKLATDEEVAKTLSDWFLANTYNNRGYAYYLMGQHARAIDDFKKALEFIPGYVLSLRNLILAYEQINNLEMAFTHFDQLLKYNPHPYTYIDRGIFYTRQGNLDQAIADFNTAVSLDPKNISAFYQLVRAYAEQGDRANAVKAFISARSVAFDLKDREYLAQVVEDIRGRTDNARLIQEIQEEIEKMKSEPAKVDFKK